MSPMSVPAVYSAVTTVRRPTWVPSRVASIPTFSACRYYACASCGKFRIGAAAVGLVQGRSGLPRCSKIARAVVDAGGLDARSPESSGGA